MMFAFRWQEGGPWNSSGIEGIVRWLRRTWLMFTDLNAGGSKVNSKKIGSKAQAQPDLRLLRRRVHQTLRSVSRDLEQYEFNTVISSLMELLNEMQTARQQGALGSPEWEEAVEIYLKMLAPVCPHIAEELWTNQLGKSYSVHQQSWPKLDESAAAEDEITIPVQINGKVRDRITIPANASEEQIKSAALSSEGVRKFLDGKQPKKIIVVKDRLVSIVI